MPKKSTFIIQSGLMMASYDKIIIKVKGKGCYSAYTHTGVNTIAIATNIITTIQNIVSR